MTPSSEIVPEPVFTNAMPEPTMLERIRCQPPPWASTMSSLVPEVRLEVVPSAPMNWEFVLHMMMPPVPMVSVLPAEMSSVEEATLSKRSELIVLSVVSGIVRAVAELMLRFEVAVAFSRVVMSVVALE